MRLTKAGCVTKGKRSLNNTNTAVGHPAPDVQRKVIWSLP